MQTGVAPAVKGCAPPALDGLLWHRPRPMRILTAHGSAHLTSGDCPGEHQDSGDEDAVGDHDSGDLAVLLEGGFGDEQHRRDPARCDASMCLTDPAGSR